MTDVQAVPGLILPTAPGPDSDPHDDAGRRLQALIEISRLVGLGLDEPAILRHVAEALARLLGSPYARLWMLDEETGDLMLAATAGSLTDPADVGLRRPASLRNLNMAVLASGRAHQTADVDADPRWFNRAVSERLGLHTYLGVPLLAGERRYGIMTLLLPGHRAVDDGDLQLVETVATQVTLAIQHARLYAEARAQARQVATVLDVNKRLALGPELDEILARIADEAGRLLGAAWAELQLFEGDELVQAATFGASELATAADWPALDRSRRDWVAAENRRIAGSRDAAAPAAGSVHQATARAYGLGPLLCVPLRGRTRVSGLLTVVHHDDRRFSRADVGVLEAFADQAAIAVENARLYRDARHQADQLATIMHVNQRLALGPELGEILARITEEAARLLVADGATLRLLEGDELVRVATFGLGRVIAVRDRLQLGESLIGRVVAEARPLVIADPGGDPRHDADHRAEARAHGLRAWLAVPLRGRERAVGALAVFSRAERCFSQADVELLEAFADQAAIAVENARAFQQEQERRRQLEAIRDVAAEITRELDLTTLLELIIRRASELVGADAGTIFLWDEASQRLVPRAWQGIDDWVGAVHLRLGEGVVGTVALERRSMIVNDYRASEHALPIFLERVTLTAGLAEPILYQGRLVGVLGLNAVEEREPFTEWHRELLGLFADHAAIAIENARALQQEQERRRQLDTLRQLTSTLVNTVAVEELAQRIVDAVPEAFGRGSGVIGGAISTVDQQRRRIRGYAMTNIPLADKALAMLGRPLDQIEDSFVPPRNLQHEVALSGEPRHGEHLAQFITPPTVPSQVAWAIERLVGLRGMVAQPIKVHGQTLGVFLFALTKPVEVVTAAEWALMADFANTAGIALENVRLYAAAEELTRTDPLTGIPNRRHFDRMLAEEAARSDRARAPLALLLIDIDHFKAYNDARGHQAGDEALRAVAAVLRRSVRSTDCVARYGGEEFAVLLPGTDAAGARAVGEKARLAMAEAPLGLTISVGGGVRPAPDGSGLPAAAGAALVAAADAALYAAKRGGRNRTVV